MKIIVSVKQVPARDSALRVNGDGRWLDESGLSYEMNEPDAYALEEALQLKRRSGEKWWCCARALSECSRQFARRWPKVLIVAFTSRPERLWRATH